MGYQYDYEEIRELYSNNGKKDVSKIVKDREISNEDRDEWLLPLACEFNHTALAKALIKLPNTQVKFYTDITKHRPDHDAVEYMFTHDNRELIDAFFQSEKGQNYHDFSQQRFIHPDVIDKLINDYDKNPTIFGSHHAKTVLESGNKQLGVDMLIAQSKDMVECGHFDEKSLSKKQENDVMALIESGNSALVADYIKEQDYIHLDTLDAAVGYNNALAADLIFKELEKKNLTTEKGAIEVYENLAANYGKLEPDTFNVFEGFIKDFAVNHSHKVDSSVNVAIAATCLDTFSHLPVPNENLAKFLFKNVPNLKKDFQQMRPDLYKPFETKQTGMKLNAF